LLGNVAAGKVRPIGVSTKSRVKAFPDVPPLNEAGVPGFDVAGWFTICAPAKTPQPVIDKLHDEVAAIIGAPDFVQKHFIERAIEPAIGPREEFVKFIADGRKVAARIAKESTLPLR
jgi:tripartite-type tricarboxylate transporter receptor subunit TctC